MILSNCWLKQLLQLENLTEKLVQVAYLHKSGVADEHRKICRLYM